MPERSSSDQRRNEQVQPSSSKVATATLCAGRANSLKGIVCVPGDKSISHRALLLGALASGITRIKGLLEAADVLGTARAVSSLGAPASKQDDEWVVRGRGVGGLVGPDGPLDFGNSGTGARLMMGVIAGHDMRVTMVGDASLSRRPMARVLLPLRQMGLRTPGPDDQLDEQADRLPLCLAGSSDLVPITYTLPVPSAQVKSAVLLAGLHARGQTTVIEREATRDHTELMLAYFGADIDITEQPDGRHITISGLGELTGQDITVPADPSSAAFPVAAALIVPGSDITVSNVLINPTRTGFYKTLTEMGADVEFLNRREAGGEPVADIRARYSQLKGVSVPAERAPSMIDEYPVLAVVAAFARGETLMQGLAELKVKESDRLAATAAGLEVNGVGSRIDGDSLIVNGAEVVKGGGLVKTHLDHRIAMAFLTMGFAAEKPVCVDDAQIIATSFPQYRDLMSQLGGKFEEGPRA